MMTDLTQQMKEKIEELNKKAGKKLTIDELIKSGELSNLTYEISCNRKGIDKYVLMHVTDYKPKDDKIRTVTEKGIKVKEETPFGEIEYRNRRNTTHFTVNSTVTSHFFGNWDNKRYAVMSPLKNCLDEDKNELRFNESSRFFCKGIS